MLQLFIMHKYYMLGISGLFICSNLIMILEYFIYLKLLKESEDISFSNRERFQFVIKAYQEFQDRNHAKENGIFENYNKKCVNQKQFVDKYLQKLKFFGIKIGWLRHLSGQLSLVGVMVSGFGACVCILEEKGIREIIPFYVICFIGVYLYFAISAFTDLPEKRNKLRLNLLDSLEDFGKSEHEQKRIVNDNVWNSNLAVEENFVEVKSKLSEMSKKEKELYDLIDEIFLT